MQAACHATTDSQQVSNVSSDAGFEDMFHYDASLTDCNKVRVRIAWRPCMVSTPSRSTKTRDRVTHFLWNGASVPPTIPRTIRMQFPPHHPHASQLLTARDLLKLVESQSTGKEIFPEVERVVLSPAIRGSSRNRSAHQHGALRSE